MTDLGREPLRRQKLVPIAEKEEVERMTSQWSLKVKNYPAKTQKSKDWSKVHTI